MIIGIGCDLAEVNRIQKALGQAGFAARVFTQREQDYCNSRGVQSAQSYAARFAAKEAFLKAIGTGRSLLCMVILRILPPGLARSVCI